MTLLRAGLIRLRDHANKYPLKAHADLSDRQHNWYFNSAIEKAREGANDIAKVISELKKLTSG